MPISHLLEDFDNEPASLLHHSVSEESLEDARLAAFEKGYQAGWEDASTAHANEQAHISAEFSRNLNDLSFTYHEAYSQVIRSIRPILTRMLDDIVPEVARHAFGFRLVEEAMGIFKKNGQGELVLTLSPASARQLEHHLTKELPMPVRILEDDTLGVGQAYLKLGEAEKCVDLDSLVAEMKALITGYLHEFREQETHG